MISIIIPTRDKEDITTDLSTQTYKDFEIVIAEDKELNGAAWARNKGAEKAMGEYLFFCDDDLKLNSNVLKNLLEALEKSSADWAYGWYILNGIERYKNRKYNLPLIDTPDLIDFFYEMHSTILIRRKSFIKYDEEFKRFEDWEMYIRMAEQGYKGIYVDCKMHSSEFNGGISSGGNESIGKYRAKLDKKHPR